MADETIKASTARPFGLQKPIGVRAIAVVGSENLSDLVDAPSLTARNQSIELPRGLAREEYCEIYEDFLGRAGEALPTWLTTQDTSAAGSPTLDFVDDAKGGQYQLLTDSTSEAQNLSLYGGDQLTLTIDAGLIVEARVKLDADAIPWTADQRLVIGLASDRNATLDDVATNAWFRVDGASANILWESDDGTTDDDDNDSGVDIADDTWVVLRIEVISGASVQFYVDGALVGTGDLSDASGNAVQFFAELQRDAGTETEALVFDYIRIVQPRS